MEGAEQAGDEGRRVAQRHDGHVRRQPEVRIKHRTDALEVIFAGEAEVMGDDQRDEAGDTCRDGADAVLPDPLEHDAHADGTPGDEDSR